LSGNTLSEKETPWVKSADDRLLTAEAVEIYSELPAQVVSSGGRA